MRLLNFNLTAYKKKLQDDKGQALYGFMQLGEQLLGKQYDKKPLPNSIRMGVRTDCGIALNENIYETDKLIAVWESAWSYCGEHVYTSIYSNPGCVHPKTNKDEDFSILFVNKVEDDCRVNYLPFNLYATKSDFNKVEIIAGGRSTGGLNLVLKVPTSCLYCLGGIFYDTKSGAEIEPDSLIFKSYKTLNENGADLDFYTITDILNK